MECQKYHELISAYIDNETSGPETEELLEHLRKCHGCKKVLESYSNLRTLLRQDSLRSPEPLISPDFSQRVLERLETPPATAFFPKKEYLKGIGLRLAELLSPRPFLAGSLATILILLSLGTFYYFNQKISPVSPDPEGIDLYLYQHTFRAAENTIGDLSIAGYYREEK